MRALIAALLLGICSPALAQVNIVPAGNEVVSAPLEAPSVDAIGIKGQALPQLWQGSDRALLAQWIDGIDFSAQSPAQHALALKLLSAQANPPKGDGDWLATRLSALLKLGEERALSDMVAQLPRGDAPELSDRMLVEQEWLKGDSAKACEAVEKATASYGGTYWQRANIFCLAVQKKNPEMELALGVLSEQGDAMPMEEAVRAVSGEKIKDLPPLQSLRMSPLEAAIALAAGVKPADDLALPGADPAVARLFALQSKWPLALRAELAERAFSAGALPGDQLVLVYKQFAFKPAQLDAAVKSKQWPENPVEARAMLAQLLEKAASPEQYRDTLLLFDAKAERMLVYRLVAPKAQQFALPATLDGLWKDFAPKAVAILLAGGEDRSAFAWWQAIQALPERPAGYEDMRPLAALVFGEQFAPDGFLLKAADAGYARRVAAVFAGLGQEASPAVLVRFMQSEPQPAIDFATARVLSDASSHARGGEAAVIALSALGGGEAADMTLVHVIRALKAVGFENDARAIAREALLGALP